MKQEKHKLFMNMDKELHDKLKKVAKEQHRSVSAQIHAMLYSQLEKEK